MIVEPEQRIPDFAKAGADIISVHAEQQSTIHLHRVVNMVRGTRDMLGRGGLEEEVVAQGKVQAVFSHL
eukprot:365130-Chlamydomonas_euryale.AAC.28